MHPKHHVQHPFRLIVAIVVGLGAIFAVLIWGLNTRSELDANSVSFGNQLRTNTTLAVHPGSVEIKAGTTVNMNIDMNAAEEVISADVVLTYDPALLKPVVIKPAGKTQAEKYLRTDDSLFTEFTKYSIDSAKGKIVFSAAPAKGGRVKGPGRVATVAFKALKPGVSQVSFVFGESKGANSKVTSANSIDILDSVSSSVVTVK